MMSWDFPYRLGGPVLAWEMHRGNQLWTVRILTICFLTFCLLHFFSGRCKGHVSSLCIQSGSFCQYKEYGGI